LEAYTGNGPGAINGSLASKVARREARTLVHRKTAMQNRSEEIAVSPWSG